MARIRWGWTKLAATAVVILLGLGKLHLYSLKPHF
jgi:hypothetical protein